MARIVHAADLHIDGAAQVRGRPDPDEHGAARRSVIQLVKFVRQINADLLIIAGDIFDRDADSAAAGRFFAAQMRGLRRHGVRVLAAAGNHDASCPAAMAEAGDVEWFTTSAANSHLFGGLAVAVHGRGLADPREPADLTGGFPPPVAGYANVGVLHTSLDGANSRSICAPTSIERLAARGYHYWALGHVHQRRVAAISPWIVYPGTLQGRRPHEPGTNSVMVIDTTGENVTAVHHHDLPVPRRDQIRVPRPRHSPIGRRTVSASGRGPGVPVVRPR